MPKVKKHFYAVKKGLNPGIYKSWDEVEPLVSGFPGAQHRSFATLVEAQDYMGMELAYTEIDDPSLSINDEPANSASSPAATSSKSPRVRPYPPTSPNNKGQTSISSPSSRSRVIKEADVEDESGWDVVYTDGSCTNNGGRGAKAGIGVWWGHDDPRNLSERCPGEQTNNRAELIAIIRALETTPITDKPLLIKTDSSYSIQCIRDWLPRWRQNGYKTSTGTKVKNIEVILYLSYLRENHRKVVKLKHIKGHAGHEGNEGADFVAQRGTWLDEVPDRDWSIPGVNRSEVRPGSMNLTAPVSKPITNNAIVATSTSIASNTNTLKPTSTSQVIGAQELEEYANCLLSAEELAEEDF